MSAYDAVLLVSFGGPEGPDEVIPFLENVTRGRGIPRERLEAVGKHYYHFGGVSPINAQNRALVGALHDEFARRGIDLPVYFGNRNWRPLLADTLRTMADDGVSSVLFIVTSCFASYSGCRQYREDVAAAADAAGVADSMTFAKIRHYFDHPGFVDTMVANTSAALARLPDDGGVRVLFTTHSIPLSAARTSGPPGWYDPDAGGAFVTQQRAVAAQIMADVAEGTGRHPTWDLVFQSRSGPPHIPWLEPDIVDALDEAKAGGATGVVIVPIGFVSDHMEVVWDLDTEAAAHAAEIGLPVVRAATVGTAPTFVAGLADLVQERVNDVPPSDRPALTEWGPSYDLCPEGCCANPRGARPAVCGLDAPLTGV